MQPVDSPRQWGKPHGFGGALRSRLYRLSCPTPVEAKMEFYLRTLTWFRAPKGTPKRVTTLTVLLSLLAVLLTPASAQAAQSNGLLDLSFNSDGAGGFNAGFNGTVTAMAVQPDGKVVVAGLFRTYNVTTTAEGIARLHTDGSIDSTFVTGTGFVHAGILFPEDIAIAADGSIYVAGGMTSYNGEAVSSVVKLSSTGLLDTTFNSGFVSSQGTLGGVNAVLLTPDGGLLVGGGFRQAPVHPGTPTRPAALLKVNSTTGATDSTFLTNIGRGFDPDPATSYVYDMVLHTNNDVVVVGGFSAIGTTPVVANNLALINQNGTNQTTAGSAGDPYRTFATNAGSGFGNMAEKIARDSSGKLYVIGPLQTFNSSPSPYIASLNSDGSRNTTFNVGTGFSSGQFRLAVDSDNNVLVVGTARNYNGASVPSGVFRIQPSGALDTGFVAGIPSNQGAQAVAPLSNGDVYLAGWFTTYSSKTVGRMVRITVDPNQPPAPGGEQAPGGQQAVTQADNELARTGPDLSLVLVGSGVSALLLVIGAAATLASRRKQAAS